MEKLKDEIDKLVNEEIKNAATIHPPKFASLHEAYAVIAEERDEAWEEIEQLEEWLAQSWECIKKDDERRAKAYLVSVEYYAMNAAVELVHSPSILVLAIAKNISAV